MKKNGIVLGIILVVIGCIILLKSFGVLTFSWWMLWKVWPFIFIFIGIAILPVNKGIKALLYAISIMACVALMIYDTKVFNANGGSLKDHLKRFFDTKNYKELKINILESDQISYFNFSDSITQMKVKGNFLNGDYVFDSDQNKGTFRLLFHGANYKTSIKEKETSGFFNITPKGQQSDNSTGKIFLDEKYSYTMDLEGEKSNINVYASHLKMDTLYINAYQESTWDVTLSQLSPTVYVFIKTHPNAENIDLKIPSVAGYQFKTTMLSDTVKWNNQLPDEKGAYYSDNFSTAPIRIFIDSNTRNVNVIQDDAE